MNFKTLAAAAIIAALPMAASASVVLLDDGTTLIGSGETVEGLFLATADGGAGDFQHNFELETDGAGSALVTVNLGLIDAFEGLVAQWLNTDTNAVLSSVAITGVETTLSTTFVDPDSLNQTLQILWTGSLKGTGFDGTITVSTVPVPAGLLLMGTALAGLGMTRRKKA